jgi:hypothetical protein
MNLTDSFVFAAIGSAMEALPRAFPNWFPHPAGDPTSRRALWLEFMGAVQITLCLAMILGARVLPALRRAFALASEDGQAAVPAAVTRAVPGP